MFRLLLFAMLLSVFFVQPTIAQEDEPLLLSDEPPYPCPYTDGTFFQPGVFPRYDTASHNLILVNGQGEFVRVLETIEQNFVIINWSPDCRYLTGSLEQLYGSYEGEVRTIALWDTTAEQRNFKLAPHFGNALTIQPATVLWSPDSRFALILGGCSGIRSTCMLERIRFDYLWRSDTNDVVRVGGYPIIQLSQNESYRQGQFSQALFNQVYWDTARGWVWGSAQYGVYAYDLSTGEEKAFFSNCEGCWAESRFLFSDDGSKVIIYSVARANDVGRGGITIHDLATGSRIEVNAEGFAATTDRYIDYAPTHPVALSADNRYLVAGYDALRVWDIQNLPQKIEDRLPIYRHGGPERLITSLRFADWGVIETTSAEDGVQKWDLHTGVYIQ